MIIRCEINFMKCDISVIVPIYNEEQYISQCIDSILNNQNCDFEILMIDDGSTDRSADVCRKYHEIEPRCKLIQKNNGGSVSARNEGIRASAGKYIAFVDADDWIDEGYLDEAISIIKRNNETDVFVWKMVKASTYGNIDLEEDEFEKAMNRSEAIEEMFSWKHFRWELAGKIYRKELFENYCPQEKITIAEDLDSNWILFNKANCFLYSNKRKYYYRNNPLSITRTINPLKNDSWMVYSKILCDIYYKNYTIVSSLTKRTWESMWNTYRVAYLMNVDECKSICDSIELTARRIYDYSDLEICMLPVLWHKYKSFENMLLYNIERNYRSIIDKIGRRIWIYGCGNIATYISWLCIRKGIEIQGYIVSNSSENSDTYMEKRVWNIDEYKENEGDMIIVAMNYEKQMDVRNILNKTNIHANVVYPECWQ